MKTSTINFPAHAAAPLPAAKDMRGASRSKNDTVQRARLWRHRAAPVNYYAPGARCCDPEQAIQEDAGRLGNALAFLLVGWFAFPCALSNFKKWLRLKRVCAWCNHRLAGNPFSKNVTHGVCASCKEKVLATEARRH